MGPGLRSTLRTGSGSCRRRDGTVGPTNWVVGRFLAAAFGRPDKLGVKMSVSIEDILTDSERLLWQGEPDYSQAENRPKSWMRRRIQHLAWAVGFGGVTALVLFLGAVFGLGEAHAWVFGILALITFFILFGFVSSKPTPSDLAKEPPTYVLTDRRVILIISQDCRTSVFTLGAAFVDLRPNGKVHDLWIFSAVEDLEVKMSAIADGPKVERMVIETLAARQNTNWQGNPS